MEPSPDGEEPVAGPLPSEPAPETIPADTAAIAHESISDTALPEPAPPPRIDAATLSEPRPWLAWLAWLSLASAAVSIVDLVFCTFEAPVTTSSIGGALQAWAIETGTLFIFGVPFALGLALLDRERVRAVIPSPAALVASTASGLIGTWAIFRVSRVFTAAKEEFVAEPERAEWVAIAMVLTFSVFARVYLQRELERRAPDPRGRMTTALLAGCAIVALYLAHRAFAPIHLPAFAGIAELGGVVALALALRRFLFIPSPRDQRVVIGATLAAALAGAHLPLGREHARFVILHRSMNEKLDGQQCFPTARAATN